MACRLAGAKLYLNQCWNIVNWTLGNKLQWNRNRNGYIFIQENAFENAVCEMVYILFRPQRMNSLYLCDSDVSILASSTKKSWHQNTFCMYYSDVIMSAIASQIIDVSIVCSTVCSGADQRKHQSSVSLAFVRGIHRWPGDPPHERSITQEMFLCDDALMLLALYEMIPQA